MAEPKFSSEIIDLKQDYSEGKMGLEGFSLCWAAVPGAGGASEREGVLSPGSSTNSSACR